VGDVRSWPDRTQPPPPAAAATPRRRLAGAARQPLVALGHLHAGGLRAVLTLSVVAVALGCGLTGFLEGPSAEVGGDIAQPDLSALDAGARSTHGRVELSSAEGLLLVRVSRARSLGENTGSVAMAVGWLTFTGFWTRGAYLSGAPLPFVCFSAPFWFAGGHLLGV